MYCSRCGASMDPAESFCRACGAATGNLNAVPVVGYSAAPGAAPAVSYAAPMSIYAGFWLRLVAHLIDGLIIGIPVLALILSAIVMTGAGAALTSKNLDNEDTRNFIAAFGIATILGIILVCTIFGWLYYAYSESSIWQGTLGKKAMGIYVTDLTGNRVTFARASGRFFAKIITGMIPLCIGYIMAGFTERKQALHDMIASCLVLRRQAVAAWATPTQTTNQPL